MKRVQWLPFAGGVLWLAYEGAIGALAADLFHTMLVALTAAGWLLARGFPVPAGLVVLLMFPALVHFLVDQPSARKAFLEKTAFLEKAAIRQEGGIREQKDFGGPRALEGTQAFREKKIFQGEKIFLRVEGVIRDTWKPKAGGGRLALLLGDVRVWRKARIFELAELEVVIPKGNPWRLPRRRTLRLGGSASLDIHCPSALPSRRLCLRFDDSESTFEHHLRGSPPATVAGEALRARLRDRAAYRLSAESLAVYLPIVLGLRERKTPESRDVAGVFRRVGIAHLFAISGLHVGLLYLLLGGIPRTLYRFALGALPLGQGWVHAWAFFRVGATVLVWGYVAMIGFPVSAVRAALMGSVLIWNEHWGVRVHPMLVLGTAGLLILLPDPSRVYDLSFQMSFLAYFFLLCALGTHGPAMRWVRGRILGSGPAPRKRWRFSERVVHAVSVNLWLTAFITLGMWPILVTTFGRVSMVVFIGNLVMIPIMSLLVLPLGVASLVAAMLSLDAPVGGWIEAALFGMSEASLRAWIAMARLLDRLSDTLVLSGRPDWPSQAYVAYYLLILGLVAVFMRGMGKGKFKKG